jgi:hypothetical protein
MQLAPIQDTFVDRLFSWWYAVAAPVAPAGDVPLSTRELVRKGRLTSLVLLIEFLINIPSYFVSSDPQLLIPLTISMLMLCIGVVLNRLGKTMAASILVLVVVEVGMCFWLLSLGLRPGGLPTIELPYVEILIEPVLLAVSLFSPRVALPVGLYNALFIFCYFTFIPKTPELMHYLAIPQLNFTNYFGSINSLLFTAVISSLWVTSARQATRRADEAEEVNKLAETLAAQQRAALQEKQLLEESIQQIINVHVQAANGDLSARVPLDRKNVLWSVAGSLNTLLARLQSWRQEAQQGRRTEQAIQLVLQDVQHARRLGTALPIRRTGTALDPLIVEFSRALSVPAREPGATPWPGSEPQSNHDSPLQSGPSF